MARGNIANFGGKQAAPFGKGGKRQKKSKKTATGKAKPPPAKAKAKGKGKVPPQFLPGYKKKSAAGGSTAALKRQEAALESTPQKTAAEKRLEAQISKRIGKKYVGKR